MEAKHHGLIIMPKLTISSHILSKIVFSRLFFYCSSNQYLPHYTLPCSLLNSTQQKWSEVNTSQVKSSQVKLLIKYDIAEMSKYVKNALISVFKSLCTYICALHMYVCVSMFHPLSHALYYQIATDSVRRISRILQTQSPI